LVGGDREQTKADLAKYNRLHPDGRRLISGWFNRALDLGRSEPDERFEPFIFAWFAVNGWAACVTELDEDRKYIAALMRTEVLSRAFDQFIADPGQGIGRQARAFAAFWPIFRCRPCGSVDSCLRLQLAGPRQSTITFAMV
jgi:hypothetical protein